MSRILRPYKKVKQIAMIASFSIAFLSMGTTAAQAACSNPTGGAGDMMYNSSFNVMQFCDGTDWTAMKGAAPTGDNLGNHTATTALDLATNKITNLGTPTAATDAATKGYVDTAAAAASDDMGDHEATQNIDLNTFKLVGNNGTEGIAITAAGLVGIGDPTPDAKLDVETTSGLAIWGTTSAVGATALNGTSSATTGFGIGVTGGTSSPDGTGVFGVTSGASGGDSRGVMGTSNSGSGYGGYFNNTGDGGVGVYGYAEYAVSGNSRGVFGQSASPQGRGVHAWASDNSGTNYGLYSATSSASGYGAFITNLAGGIALKVQGGVADMTSQKITNVADPTAAQDAATKAYVDTASAAAGDDLGDHTATTTLAMGANDITGTGTITATQLISGSGANGGLQWESGVNRITNNDGGGNVQIRFGNEFSGGNIFTHAGGASWITSNIDATSNTSMTMQVSSNSGAGTGAAVTWGSPLTITATDVTFGGTSLLTGTGDDLGDHTATTKLLMQGNRIGIGTTSSQDIFGDDNSAFYLDGANATTTQLILRDSADNNLGRVYGNGSGANFGLMDADGQWSYLAQKDSNTQFRINNATVMSLYPTYMHMQSNQIKNLADPTAAQDAATKTYVDTAAAAAADNLGSGGTTTGTVYSNNASGYGYFGSSANNYFRFDDAPLASADRIYTRLGANWEYVFHGVYFGPYATNVNDLGTNGVRWKDLYLSGDANIGGDVYATGTKYSGDAKEMFRFSDAWLRLNQASDFTSGVYTPGLMRADGGFNVDTITVVSPTGIVIGAQVGSGINGDNITDGTIDASEIAANSIGSSELATDSVTATHIAANAVNTSEIANGSVSAAKIISIPDTKITGIPTCQGNDKALQWDGVQFTCATLAASGGGTANCSGNALSWGGGCSASKGTGTHNQTSTATDNACCSPSCNTCSGYIGSANVKCNNGVWIVVSSISCTTCSASENCR